MTEIGSERPDGVPPQPGGQVPPQPGGQVPPQPGGQAGGCASQTLPLEALHDVELDVEVVLGRARLPLRALLVARPRTTIELDRAVRSAVDVMVNGTLFARGEMVVVDDAQIGVQITEVVGATMAPGA